MNQEIQGIYIHIPFCLSKCYYCSFYSVADPSELLKENYITRIVEEIRNSQFEAPSLSSVYLGGGTPSILNIEQITQIVKALEDRFNFKLNDLKETTIEINPGTVDFNFLKGLKKLGFNRISVGIQTLNDYILESMGRIHSKQDSLKILKMLDELGFDNVTVDLMFNYPNQLTDSTIKDLKKLLEFDCIKHFSIYSVTVEEGTKLDYQIKNGLLELNDDSIERNTYYKIRDLLEKNGFYQYEISNFSKPGFESFHNTLYWDRKDYLSFGPASSASIGNHLIDYPSDLKSYLDKSLKPEISYLSEKEQKENFMIFGLRKTKGIFDKDYFKFFKTSFFDDFKEEIERLNKQKLIEIMPGGIKLTLLGIDFYNRVALEFIKI